MANGALDLEGLDRSKLDSESLLRMLCGMPGLGPFSAATLLQTLGRYDTVPCDTETLRHLRQHHGITCSPANVQVHAQKVQWLPRTCPILLGVLSSACV